MYTYNILIKKIKNKNKNSGAQAGDEGRPQRKSPGGGGAVRTPGAVGWASERTGIWLG